MPLKKKNLIFILDVHGRLRGINYDQSTWLNRAKNLIDIAYENYSSNSVLLAEGIPYGKSIEEYSTLDQRIIISTFIRNFIKTIKENLPDDVFNQIKEELNKYSIQKINEIWKQMENYKIEIGNGELEIFLADPVWGILKEKFPRNFGWDSIELLGKGVAFLFISLYYAESGNLEKVREANSKIFEIIRERDRCLLKAIKEFANGYENIIVYCGGLHGAVGVLLEEEFNVIYLGIDEYLKKNAKMTLRCNMDFLEDYQITFLKRILLR